MQLPEDIIELEKMEFYGYHGVHLEEQRLGQPFHLHLQLFLSLQEAGLADDLEKTVDYGKVYRQVKELVEGQPFSLLEALAEAIAGRILSLFPQVQGIQVQVKKPAPPIPGILQGVGVQIIRRRI